MRASERGERTPFAPASAAALRTPFDFMARTEMDAFVCAAKSSSADHEDPELIEWKASRKVWQICSAALAH